jgi:putative nucleotidyltransferase-like protein
LTTVLTELCRQTLTATRLDALPPTLRRRAELAALRHAVALADGERGDPGRAPYLAALAFNLARLQRLERVLEAARAAKLRLMPLKGALLVRTHYGDPGARPMVDIDLVCAPSEIERAIELCRDLGMTRFDPETFRSTRDAVHDVKLADGGVTIELHHRLWHELRIARDVEPLLERAVEVPYGATTAWAPTDADHLYVVLVHAATHGFTGNALWMTDAALLLAGAKTPLMPRVQALADAARARVALAAARDQLRVAMPWLDVDGGVEAAPLRRALLRRMAPWLQRGEGELGVWPSRVVRPLLFDRSRDLGSWMVEKLAMWRG